MLKEGVAALHQQLTSADESQLKQLGAANADLEVRFMFFFFGACESQLEEQLGAANIDLQVNDSCFFGCM